MSRLFSMRKVATPALVNREFTRAHFSQHTAMRTFTIALVALATLTACGPEPIEIIDEAGSPDRIAFAVDEQDDETEGEETGDAGMDGADPLPDAGTPDGTTEACCSCAAGCVAWSSAPPLLGQATCDGVFFDGCVDTGTGIDCGFSC